jgi:shikimate kinase
MSSASPVGVDGIDNSVVDSIHHDVGRGPVVVLVGVPGSGKTTAGRLLAERLGVPFRDTDADVEASTGRTIADIFVESGEPEFRRLEAQAVRAALDEHVGVLALGGGAVVDAATRAALAGRPVVWLRVGLAAASQRAGLSGARPVLLGNVRAQLKALMDARAPHYAEVAVLTLDSDAQTPEQTVGAIVDALQLEATR